ncbi:hypothetical protein [Actinocatenispora comari]|uniref:Uncharacterized protein n=1 Tax=Actinocatenispora comari TaxID=2807577 RepID=A0A8J4EMQ0_9ACTN|nr:hypothetical protein [Actinocatenispora comari]GIL29018.1 hypothetical protein NUM_42720 [Actinocatenispora comari]
MSHIWKFLGSNTWFTSLLAAVIGFAVKAAWDSRSKKKQRAEQRREEDERHFRDKRLEYAAEFMSAVDHIDDPVDYKYSTSISISQIANDAERKRNEELTQYYQARLDRVRNAFRALAVLRIVSPSLAKPGHDWAMAVFRENRKTGEFETRFVHAVQEELGDAVRWPAPEEMAINITWEEDGDSQKTADAEY